MIGTSCYIDVGSGSVCVYLSSIVFDGMNAYWEPLDMQLPTLPEGLRWKICVNTFVEYEDGRDVGALTEFNYESKLKIPPRSVVVLVGVPAAEI